MLKRHAFSVSRVWSGLADLIVLVVFALVLLGENPQVLAEVVRTYYAEVFVLGNFLFFAIGYYIIATSPTALKTITGWFKKWNKYVFWSLFIFLSMVHAFLYLFVLSVGMGDMTQDMIPFLTFVFLGLFGFIAVFTIFIGDEQEFKLKPSTLQKLFKNHPWLVGLIFGASSVLTPIATFGLLVHSVRENKLAPKKREDRALGVATGFMNVLLGVFVAMMLSFEVLSATQGFEIESVFTSLLGRILVVGLIWYLPYKLFALVADEHPNMKFELSKSLVVIAIEVAMIYVLIS